MPPYTPREPKHLAKKQKMVYQFFSLPLVFPLLLFIFMIWRIRKRSNTNAFITTARLPPGPWKLPIIGNMHQVTGPLPHHTLRNLANKYGPVMSLQLGELTTIIVSSPDIAKEILKTHDVTFADRPFSIPAVIVGYNSTDIIFSSYGDYWRQLRKICILELLSAKRVQSFRSIREQEVKNFMASISSNAGSVVNLSKLLLSYSSYVTALAAFDKITKEQEAFIPLSRELTELAAGFSIADLFPSIKFLRTISGMRAKLERLHREADRILGDIINDHKVRKAESKNTSDKGEDLVDVLLKVQQRGLEFQLTIDNIKAVILDIFSAGTETSAATSEWAMTEMLKSPRTLKKAQAEVRQVFGKKGYVDEAGLGELSYLKLVIKETLRLHPPLPLLIPRQSRAHCEINGYIFPAKTRLLINVWGLGRDPNSWVEAEKFNPERFSDGTVDFKGNNFEFIPFGSGRRICPGMSFGLANVELPLASLLYHFDWKLPPGIKEDELDMDEIMGSVVKRKNDLGLVPTLRNPLPVLA